MVLFIAFGGVEGCWLFWTFSEKWGFLFISNLSNVVNLPVLFPQGKREY